jgi:hypothetical protein
MNRQLSDGEGKRDMQIRISIILRTGVLTSAALLLMVESSLPSNIPMPFFIQVICRRTPKTRDVSHYPK